jgi:hypothetical protein
MAIYDLLSQYSGLPLYKFLGGYRDQIETDFTASAAAERKYALLLKEGHLLHRRDIAANTSLTEGCSLLAFPICGEGCHLSVMIAPVSLIICIATKVSLFLATPRISRAKGRRLTFRAWSPATCSSSHAKKAEGKCIMLACTQLWQHAPLPLSARSVELVLLDGFKLIRELCMARRYWS